MRFASFCRNCFIQEDITQVNNQIFEICVFWSFLPPPKKKSPGFPPKKTFPPCDSRSFSLIPCGTSWKKCRMPVNSHGAPGPNVLNAERSPGVCIPRSKPPFFLGPQMVGCFPFHYKSLGFVCWRYQSKCLEYLKMIPPPNYAMKGKEERKENVSIKIVSCTYHHFTEAICWVTWVCWFIMHLIINDFSSGGLELLGITRYHTPFLKNPVLVYGIHGDSISHPTPWNGISEVVVRIHPANDGLRNDDIFVSRCYRHLEDTNHQICPRCGFRMFQSHCISAKNCWFDRNALK